VRVIGALMAALATACFLAAVAPRPRAWRPARAELDFIRDSTHESRRGQAPDEIGRRLLRALTRRLGLREGLVRRQDLVEAGLDPETVSPAEVVALKLLGGTAAALATLVLSAALPTLLLLAPAAGWAGFLLPSLWLRRRRRRRQAQVLAELPDLVGLLRAFVSAQVPLEQALNLISAQLAEGDPANILAAELRRALGEYGLGRTIDESLAAMADRLGTDELHTVAGAIAQGKRLGRGMELVLRDQELLLRMSQRNRAAAAASQISTRLMGVLVGVYLPEFVILVMVPLFWGIIIQLGPA
jgi:tight adherence protein C